LARPITACPSSGALTKTGYGGAVFTVINERIANVERSAANLKTQPWFS